MNRLLDLWLEMLAYRKLAPAREKTTVILTCGSEEMELLLQAGIGQLTERGILAAESRVVRPDGLPADRLRIGEKEILLPEIYGLTETEAAGCGTWEEYRARFRGKEETCLCAGEFLCRLADGFAGKQTGFTAPAEISADDGTYMVWKTVCCPAEDFFYFDNTYQGRLKELQERQLACLDEFDRICRKHGISYFLGGGTLLGAVRHQAVIPWDDDVDVMMLRDEYEKFVRVAEREIRPEFFYQSSATDPEYHSIFDKIRLNGTEFVTEFSQRFPGMHQGIFIDIFVHDRTAAGKRGQRLHVFLTLWARSLVFHKWEGTDMHFYGRMKTLCRLMTIFKNRTSMRTLERLQRRVVTWYRRKQTGWLYDGTGEHLRRGAFPEAWLAGTRKGYLSGKAYPIPAEAERYLAYSYGEDYMTLPAPQERKAAHPIVRLAFSADRPEETIHITRGKT